MTVRLKLAQQDRNYPSCGGRGKAQAACDRPGGRPLIPALAFPQDSEGEKTCDAEIGWLVMLCCLL